MKFSEIKIEEWSKLAPYLDTCLLPITGLSGKEQPWEITIALEQLRDLIDLVEIPHKGRIITYPAFHYGKEVSGFSAELDKLCDHIKHMGVMYIILISAQIDVTKLDKVNADLCITAPTSPFDILSFKKQISERIVSMWTSTQLTKL